MRYFLQAEPQQGERTVKQNNKVSVLRGKMVCGCCGGEIGSGQNFCPVCGTPLKSALQLLAEAKQQNSEALGILMDYYDRPVRIAALAITKNERIAEQLSDAVMQNITAIDAEQEEDVEKQLSAMIFQKSMEYMIDKLTKNEEAVSPAGTLQPETMKN